MANALIVTITAAFIGLVTYAGIAEYREQRACWDQDLIPVKIHRAGIRCIALPAIAGERE